MEKTAQELFDEALDLYKQEKFDEVIEKLRLVSNEENRVLYAKVQVTLGAAYGSKGNLDNAIEVLQKVPSVPVEQYAQAQLNLGITYYKKNDLDNAIATFQKIPSQIVTQYAKAQSNLGIIYYANEELDKAIKAFQKIPVEMEFYSTAQFNLGKLYIKINDIDKARSTFQNISQQEPYIYEKARLYLSILNSHNYKTLFSLEEDINELLFMLQVTKKELFGAEQNLAHYTRPKVAFALLGDKQNPAASFRLSSIRGVNDPTEGEIFFRWLGFESKKNENLATFISCFTFNHDSLNQFRLYGKENNEEASGVSLVMNGSAFFEQSSFSSSISTTILTEKSDKQSENQEIEKEMPKLLLYRCIYLDLESNYISLASREEITFLRENHPKLDFSTYRKGIEDKQKQVEQKLIKIRDKVRKINKVLKDRDREIVTHILLPLRYLVKHAAFKEEQEARMFYSTSLFDPKIKINSDYNQMYLEYSQPVKSAIHKIYLSPGAEKYQDFFIRCLGENSADKIRISSNPFRSKK